MKPGFVILLVTIFVSFCIVYWKSPGDLHQEVNLHKTKDDKKEDIPKQQKNCDGG
jgi:hypothetical protein